jgi:hypothetical protein
MTEKQNKKQKNIGVDIVVVFVVAYNIYQLKI